MGEICAFQPPLTSEGARRLSGALRAMVDAGSDPGPRGPQIRLGGERLGVLVEELRRELIELGLSTEFEHIITDLEHLARIARCYEGDFTSGS